MARSLMDVAMMEHTVMGSEAMVTDYGTVIAANHITYTYGPKVTRLMQMVEEQRELERSEGTAQATVKPGLRVIESTHSEEYGRG
jgi:hypothetical protein